MPTRTDQLVHGEGTVYLLHAVSACGVRWVKPKCAPAGVTWKEAR